MIEYSNHHEKHVLSTLQVVKERERESRGILIIIEFPYVSNESIEVEIYFTI